MISKNSKNKRSKKFKGKGKKEYNSFEEISHRKKYRCQRVKIVIQKSHRNSKTINRMSLLLVVPLFNEKISTK